MSGVVYAPDGGERRGVVISHMVAAVAHLALLDEEAELMESIDRCGPSAAREKLLNRCRLALAQLGRTPAEAWADRCRYLDRVAS